MSPAPIIAIILGSIAAAVSGQVSFKTAMNRMGAPERGVVPPHWRRGLPVLGLGLALYFLSMLLWLLALSRVELSFAFPFISLSYVGITLAARFRLGERLTASRVIGAAVIVGGVLLVSLTR